VSLVEVGSFLRAIEDTYLMLDKRRFINPCYGQKEQRSMKVSNRRHNRGVLTKHLNVIVRNDIALHWVSSPKDMGYILPKSLFLLASLI
jgi:hypothetical protein